MSGNGNRYLDLPNINSARIAAAAQAAGLVSRDLTPIALDPVLVRREAALNLREDAARSASRAFHSAVSHATVLFTERTESGRVIESRMLVYPDAPDRDRRSLARRSPELDLTVHLSRGGRDSNWWDRGISIEVVRGGKLDSRHAGPIGDGSTTVEVPVNDSQSVYSQLAKNVHP